MRVMHAYLQVGTYSRAVWEDHVAIAGAVAHGDGDRAVALLTKHLSESRDAILAHLRTKGELA